jgi:rhomboid family GlyGly-CTERM serine protease
MRRATLPAYEPASFPSADRKFAHEAGPLPVAPELKSGRSGADTRIVPVRGWATAPWATGLAALLAVVVQLHPSWMPALIYERTAVQQGEWWRLWTGNFVHLNASHLGWNLLVLVPAGTWVERLAPWRTRILLLAGPAFIGAMLLAADTTLLRYAGLSGVVAGVLALLAFTRLAAGREDRLFWIGVLLLLAGKIAIEAFATRPLFGRWEHSTAYTVPLAHFMGVGAALLVHFTRRRSRRLPAGPSA